jgi:hypothetical protein
MRMYATNIDDILVGERNRRIPLDGVNPFVRSAHEFQIANTINSILQKRHGDKMSNAVLVGVAQPSTDAEIESHKEACNGYIERTIEWRTKFTNVCNLKRQDAANLFPWIPKMSVFKKNDFLPDGQTLAPKTFGYIEGAITMELFQPLDDSPTMKFEDFKMGEYPESVKAAMMRFAYKCDMSSQSDPCFLLEKSCRKPLENYVNELHAGISLILPFSFPGALRQFLQAHEKHHVDKAIEARKATNRHLFASITADSLNQGLCYGSLVLSTHISRMRSNYYRSDTIDGMQEILDFIMETTADGCNMHRLLCDAREQYEQDLQDETEQENMDMKRDMSGVQFWRGIHGHNILKANYWYTMHSCNLNAFEELFTSSCGHFFGSGKNWDSFGLPIHPLPYNPS